MRLALALLFPALATCAILTPATCSSADVQETINSADSGDTVRLPTPCSPTGWAVSIPSTKGITLDLNGATVGGSVAINPHATAGSRLTNGTMTSSGAVDVTGTSLSTARWRIDNITFTAGGSPSVTILDINASPGLIDHCTFSGLTAAQEFIHIFGWGAASTTGWTNAHTPGSDEAIYFEDNTFTTSTSEPNNSWIQSYYGARSVYRFNTFAYTRVDAHGTVGSIGARWWEFYHNTFSQTGGNTGGNSISLRAGSGLIFANTDNGTLAPGIGLCEEDSGYPANYQIGRGQNQTLYPAYSWANTGLTTTVDECEAPETAGMVALNRDVYRDSGASCPAGGTCASGIGTGTTLPIACTINTGFWRTDVGGNWDTSNGSPNDGALYKCTATDTWTLFYTPFTYPHPLQGAEIAVSQGTFSGRGKGKLSGESTLK